MNRSRIRLILFIATTLCLLFLSIKTDSVDITPVSNQESPKLSNLPNFLSSFDPYLLSEPYQQPVIDVQHKLVSTSPPTDDGLDVLIGQPIWDDTVIAILEEANQPPRMPALQYYETHINWDETTNQYIEDPTIQMITDAIQTVPEYMALAADKLAALDNTCLVYHVGYQAVVSHVLDADWVHYVLSSSIEMPAYGVIQFKLPMDTAARYELEEAGVRFYNYLEGGGLYARVPPNAIGLLQQLFTQANVRYAGPIPYQARIETTLLNKAQTTPNEQVTVVVTWFDPPTAEQLLEIATYFPITATSAFSTSTLLAGTLEAGAILELSTLPYLRWIELQQQSPLANLESTMALGTDVLRSADPLSSTGAGVRVAVIDTGIAAAPYHLDLPENRVLDQHEYFPNDDATADDQHGHGTHVTGILGGSGAGSANDWLEGHAPDVDFLIYKLCCDVNGTGFSDNDFENALDRSATNGARVVNCSWGNVNLLGVYNRSSELADGAVRGDNGQEMTIVVASGNENNLPRPPSTAKNVITVGAVNGGNWPAGQVIDCGDGTTGEDWPPGERACFSNHGPLDTDADGRTRVKPDLVAVGTQVRSTTFNDAYREDYGTSMATPAVTGAIAAFLSHYPGYARRPGLIKAQMLASAIDIGNDTALYGHGLVDLFHMVS